MLTAGRPCKHDITQLRLTIHITHKRKQRCMTCDWFSKAEAQARPGCPLMWPSLHTTLPSSSQPADVGLACKQTSAPVHMFSRSFLRSNFVECMGPDGRALCIAVQGNARFVQSISCKVCDLGNQNVSHASYICKSIVLWPRRDTALLATNAHQNIQKRACM